MKKIMVTGAAGFIGSHLSAELLKKGHIVCGVDNFYSGSRINIENLAKNAKFSFIEHDVVAPFAAEVAAAADYAEIYHLACPASPPHYQADPLRTMLINVQGTFNMLELAKRCGARFLQASTSEIYGDPLVNPQPESYLGNVNPIGPRACYDEGKRAAESLCFDMNRRHGVLIKVARIFNTYGPNMREDDGRVVSNFFKQALGNKPLTIYGDGSQTRSFCYIDDMVAGLIALMESAPEITGPFNIGNPEEFTIEELAEKIIEITGTEAGIEYKMLPVDDPKQRRPDIRLAEEILGWRPEISLDKGLRKMHNQQLKNSAAD